MAHYQNNNALKFYKYPSNNEQMTAEKASDERGMHSCSALARGSPLRTLIPLFIVETGLNKNI